MAGYFRSNLVGSYTMLTGLVLGIFMLKLAPNCFWCLVLEDCLNDLFHNFLNKSKGFLEI